NCLGLLGNDCNSLGSVGNALARGRRARAGCTQAASTKLNVCAWVRVMTTKPTNWIQITTGFDGRAIHGSYAVGDGVVKVKTPRGKRAAQVDDVSTPIWLAVSLLRELAKEGKG